MHYTRAEARSRPTRGAKRVAPTERERRGPTAASAVSRGPTTRCEASARVSIPARAASRPPRTSPRGDGVRIQVDEREILHEHLAVDHRQPDVGAARGVDERRPGVAIRREVRPIAVDDDEVGALARLDRSDLVLQPERPRALARRHPDHVARRQRARARAARPAASRRAASRRTCRAGCCTPRRRRRATPRCRAPASPRPARCRSRA